MILCGMLDLCRLILAIVIDLFRPRAAVEAEILVLRQQIIVLRRGRPGRVPLSAVDRMVLGWVYQLFPKTREASWKQSRICSHNPRSRLRRSRNTSWVTAETSAASRTSLGRESIMCYLRNNAEVRRFSLCTLASKRMFPKRPDLIRMLFGRCKYV